MGGSISSLFGLSDDECGSDYLQLTDLGGFLSKYIFIMLDKDKRKLVSKQEYLKLVNHFREEKTTEEELDIFLKQHATPGQSTEYIDQALFKKLIIHLAIDFDLNVNDRMKYLMTLFDKDNDGFVSEEDLRRVYDGIGIQVPLEPIRSLIGRYDEDGDKKLSVTEFENLGRSAMQKLFIRKNEPFVSVNALVEEALRKGSASLMTPQHRRSPANHDEAHAQDKDCHHPTIDINNNHVPPNDPCYMTVNNVKFGKPVVLDAATSLFAAGDADLSDIDDQSLAAKVVESADLGESEMYMAGAMNELQVEGE